MLRAGDGHTARTITGDLGADGLGRSRPGDRPLPPGDSHHAHHLQAPGKLALAELETSVASGRVSSEDRTLAALLDSWMDHLVELGRADTTLYTYRRYVEKELKPSLGAIRSSRLTALDIDRLYAKLRKRGLTPASIRQIHAILRAALHQAERWGLVDRNVARLASPPSQPQREQHPPNTDEVIALLDAAIKHSPLFGLFIRVMVATGMRRAEVCGLRWSHIDFDTGRLNVSRSYLAIATARGDRPTKTRSARDISLDPVTLDQLETGWREAARVAWQFRVSADERRSAYIFTSDPTGGQPWRPDSANAWWATARRSLDPPSTCRMHDLRHFQATKLLDAGVPVPTVAARLGHADGITTMKIYAHRTQRADDHAGEVVGRILGGSSSSLPGDRAVSAEPDHAPSLGVRFMRPRRSRPRARRRHCR